MASGVAVGGAECTAAREITQLVRSAGEAGSVFRPGASLLLLCAACSGARPLPPRAVELNRLGAEALAKGDLESADARLSVALEYDSEFVEALTNLGLVEIRRGNFARARQLLERSRRLNPDVAQTHHGLGVLEERRQRRHLASEHYRDALAVDPGFAESRANLARLLFEARRFEHALVEYRRLLEVSADRIDGWFGLASTLLSLGRLAEARLLIETGLQRFPGARAFTLLDGRALLLEGRSEAALLRLAPLTAELTEFTVPALAWSSVGQLELGRLALARQAADDALALEPDDPLATYALAVALDEADDPSATAWLERALVANPGHSDLGSRLSQRRRSAPYTHRQE